MARILARGGFTKLLEPHPKRDDPNIVVRDSHVDQDGFFQVCVSIHCVD
jgi:hypothetical protein